jgi:Uroporphyrinogen-III methylase
VSSSQEQGWVALIGAGPGDEGLLTVRGAELLGQAGLVVAGAGLEPAARRYMSQDATSWPTRPRGRDPLARWCRRPRAASSRSGCSPAIRC